MATIHLRPLKKADWKHFYDNPLQETVRGIVAETDEGELVGIGGVIYSQPLQCFSTIYRPMRQQRRVMVEAVRQIREILNKFAVPVYARVQADEPTSPGFLKHIGFRRVSEDIFVWETQ